MSSHRIFLVLASCALILSCLEFGCSTSGRKTATLAQLPSSARSEQADQLWDAIQDTLRHHHYTPDRVDRRGGVITTKPATSQHYFEFWRRDVATWRDFWEATINPMRRWIRVTVTPEDAGREMRLQVVVHKERLSSPDRQFNSSGAAYQFFGDQLPSTTGKPKVTAADNRWIDEGRDPAMESYLLARILRRYTDKTTADQKTRG